MKIKIKELFLLLLLLATTTITHAQDYDYVEEVPKIFIGLGTGINASTGMLGVNAEVFPHENISLYGAAGLGGWGTKLTGGIQFYGNAPRKFGWYLTYSTAFGLDNFEAQLKTVNGTLENVKLNLLPSSTINIGFNYYILIRGTKRINIGAGYSLPITLTPYEVIDNVELAEESKLIMMMMQPGGLAITLGLTFGL